MTTTEQFYTEAFRRTCREGSQAIVNLAFAQLQIAELFEEDAATWSEAIHVPVDAADARCLRTILATATKFGIMPEEDSIEEYAGEIAEGTYLKAI